MEWNADQLALREGIARWSEALSADHVEQDAAGDFPWEKWALVRKSGILGLPFDEQWGGLGQDLLTTLYVLEGLGQGCRDGGLSFSAVTSMVSVGVPLQRFARDGLRDAHLPRICSGEAIGAHAISEPDSGSDALAMRTSARREGDAFVIDGTKTFVTNGPVADLLAVYARTHPDGGPLGITAFLVERDSPGLTVGRPIGKMGLRTSPLCEVFLDGVRVPADNVIGRVGGGFLVLDHVMKLEILSSFVVNLGEMEWRLDQCLKYAKHRTAFGSRIGSFQAVAHKLVDMKIRVETSRKWLYDTAAKLTAGDNVTVDIAIAKLLTSESNLATSLDAVQVFGAIGYMTETGIEKDVRNAVAGTIYSGTTEIQYNRIASMLGL